MARKAVVKDDEYLLVAALLCILWRRPVHETVVRAVAAMLFAFRKNLTTNNLDGRRRVLEENCQDRKAFSGLKLFRSSKAGWYSLRDQKRDYVSQVMALLRQSHT